MSENTQVGTIFDRPFLLRFIGIVQVTFGFLGLLAFLGLVWAIISGSVSAIGPVYAAIMIFGVVIPCFVIGNYVDDLRRNVVIAQIVYSLMAVAITGYFLYTMGLGATWNYPFAGMHIAVSIGNLAAFILGIEAFFALYLIVKWNDVTPRPGQVIVRDRKEAKAIEEGLIPSPLIPSILSPDGETTLTDDESERILDVRRITTEEGMAVLCSNCGGATPLSNVEDDNTLVCDFCGVRLGVSSVFIPCDNHPEYLAATTCDVCGEHFCRRCLTAQEPPVDERWEGSTIHICQTCFEGRYRPAVTTTSLVIPIDQLFDKAGSRFSRVGGIYRKFLGKYAGIMKYVVEFAIRLAGNMLKAGGRASGNKGEGIIAALIMIVVIIVAIPIVVGLLLIAGAIVIIPLLFYAGLVGITVEAVKIISGTDFVSLAEAREKGVREHKPVKKKESTLREVQRDWQSHAIRHREATHPVDKVILKPKR